MENILAQIKALPPLPGIVCQLTALIDDPNSSAEDLAKVISIDQSLTTRVLRLVNSSYYAFRSKISRISHAISLIGFIATKNIVLGLSLIEAFKKTQLGDGLDHERFWEHSLSVAWAARAIAEKSGYISPEEAFVAGLLHDIGKVIFDMVDREQYKNTLEKAAREDRTIGSVEKDCHGYSHDELGAELARMWNLPEKLRTSIRDHHNDETEHELTRIVLVADNLCKARGMGFSGDTLVRRIPGRIWRAFDISNESFTNIFSDLEKEVFRTRVFLDMAKPDEEEDAIFEGPRHPGHGSSSILIASEEPGVISLPHLVLEEEGFLVRLTEMPMHLSKNERRDTGLVLIDTENETQDYPECLTVQIGEAVTREIPVRKLHSPFHPKDLIALAHLYLAQEPA